MSSQLFSPVDEAGIWARLAESQTEKMTADAARYLLGFRFQDSDQARMQELAERSQDGNLTESQAREFDSYLHVGNLIALMQSRARRVLIDQGSSQSVS